MQRSVRVLFAVAGLLVALAGGGPAGAAPPVTNGLVAQFVADDVVPTGGGTVDNWIERSAGVLTASQASAGRQPELVAGALNGHDVLGHGRTGG